MYLLVVQFLGLPRFEELQQIPKCSLIVVSERIPWTVPVPGHHTTRQGGRTTKGVGSDDDGRTETEGGGKKGSEGGDQRKRG